MLHKGWKLVFAILAIVLAGLVIWSVFFHDSVPRLSKEEKEAVRTEYINRKCGGKLESYVNRPIIWYDENGQIEKDGVWRYIGTYGDCYAFLIIGDNVEYDNIPAQNPYPLSGLARNVYYPNEAQVYLYHTTREFTRSEVNKVSNDSTLRMEELYQIKNLDEWISDKELVQLTLDIEEIAKEYN